MIKKNSGINLNRILSAGLVILVTLLMNGCSAYEWNYDPITDLNDLEGRKVAVFMSSEADYYLRARKDMKLVRYDYISDMIMALGYNKVDAIAIDNIMCTMIESRSTGLEKLDKPFGESGYVALFSSERKDLSEEFDSYLADFKKTDDYKDFLERIDKFDGMEYESPDIPLTGNGEVIRVAAMTDGFPRSFFYSDSSVPDGFDYEILKRFANEKNYRLEFEMSNYTDGTNGLENHIYDMAVGYISDVYGYEMEETGLILSDPLYIDPMYYIQKKDKKISLNIDDI